MTIRAGTGSARSRKRRRSFVFRALRGLAVLVALVLGGGYVATRVLVARAEEAFPPLGTEVDVAGLRQHVVERGKGPPVVFVHGAFGASQDFVATVVPQLSSRYRCVAWDRPGHGYSERSEDVVGPGEQARLLIALVHRLGLERPLLVGFSYGGAVTLAAALMEPQAVRGVVLLNGPSHPWPEPLDFHYELPIYPLLGPLVVEALLTPVSHLVVAGSIERAFWPQPVPASFAQSPVPLSLRPGSYRANAEDMRALKPFLREQSARYGELTLPVTMVVSEDDRVVSPTIHSPALQAAAPQSSMVRIPGAGHQILYTHTGLVIDAIDAAMGRP